MGIKNLHQVIKSVVPDYRIDYYYSELSGLSIAADISVFLYKYIRSVGKPGWIRAFIIFLCGLKRHGIKVVCIFDGPNYPPEKEKEHKKRKEELQRSLDRLKNCIKIRNSLQDDYIPFDIELSQELIQQCKNLISPRKNSKNPDMTNYYDTLDIVDSLNSVISRLERQTLPITQEDRDIAFDVVKSLGLAALKADGEAETLCAYLCIKGEVDIVLSTDTDVLAYGTPFMITFGEENKPQDEKFIGIYLPYILEKMEMNEEEFRDLCILLSCDYNERIKGFPPDGKNRKKAVSIGEKGALLMIQEYRNLDIASEFIEDPEDKLKYKRCRKLLSIPSSVPLYDKTLEDGGSIVPYNKPVDYEMLINLLPYDRESDSTKNLLQYIEKNCQKAALTFVDSESESEEEDFKIPDESDTEVLGYQNEKEIADTCETEEKPVYVILSAMCQYDGEEEKDDECLEAHFKFSSKELFDEHNDCGFDDHIESFSEWLNANNYKYWRVDDVIECKKFITEEEAIMPYVVTK